MATYNLGRVLPRFRGQWDPTINYDKLDVVYFEGSSYMAISDNINKRPDENESDWVLSAAKGEPGEPGKDGPTYKAGKGISIVNNVISATGGGDEEGGESYFNGFGIDIDLATNQINAEVKATFDVSTEWKEIEMTGLSESDIEDWNERNVFYYRGKTYYSNGANHNYVLNGTKWDKQAWIGFTDIYGRDIYIDTKGVMRYYAGNIIMKYDDDNGWKQDTINISNCYGRYMVNGLDGYDYYFENSSKMYYHEPDGTSTWTKFTGAYNIDAAYIWSDENTTYYSNGSNQYYFDYDRNRWVPMTWRGDKRDISGFNVWRQGNNVLYSDGVNTYQLKYGDTWARIASTIDIYGLSILTDGDNVFHFYDGDAKQLVLGDRHYVTRHGDELVTEDFVTKNGVVKNDTGLENYRFTEVVGCVVPGTDGRKPYIIDNKIYVTTESRTYRFNPNTKLFEPIKVESRMSFVDFVNYNPDGSITTKNNAGAISMWNKESEGWGDVGTRPMLDKLYYKDNTVLCKRNAGSYYYMRLDETSPHAITYQNAPEPWQDYDKNIWIDEYMFLDSEGIIDTAHPFPNAKIVENQGKYVWTDINGVIRLDAPGVHKMLVGSGANAAWVDFTYYGGDIIPESSAVEYVYINGSKMYMSVVDKYKTNKSDYLATEEWVKSKLGDIESILKSL